MTARSKPCAADCDRPIGDKGAQGLCAPHYQQKRRGITQLEMKPEPPRSTPPPAEPSCVGEHALFDSTDREDHALAKAICAECPALSWCAERARDLRRDHAWCQPLTGTWAGQLYGRSAGGRVLKVREPEPDYTDEELRAFHAAYYRGEKTDEVRRGERIYSRRRKARRRAELELTTAGAA